MDTLVTAVILGLLAGLPIPLGAQIARIERIQPRWLDTELRHSVVAFGGGVLLAAVSLVLVPEGVAVLPPLWVVVSFGGGGLAFFVIERALARRRRPAGQLLAMVLDFVPEALALGAAMASGDRIAMLLALLIGAQNLPEGFNAYREAVAHRPKSGRRLILTFAALALLGPVSAAIGHQVLSDQPALVGVLMLFAAGGIIYLTFEDIAPKAVLRHHWAPQLGAVAGFLFGLVGQMVLMG
jgi:ZIP family zinc transporter